MIIKVWCEAFDRTNAYLRPGDIPAAITSFGPGLTALHLNPMYLNPEIKKFPREFKDYPFPENIDVVANPGVAGWEIRGEVREDKNSMMVGQILEVPEKGLNKLSQNTPDTQQDVKNPDVKTSRGRKRPTGQNTPPDFDCDAPKTIASQENDHILAKRVFNPSSKKIYPRQVEKLF